MRDWAIIINQVHCESLYLCRKCPKLVTIQYFLPRQASSVVITRTTLLVIILNIASRDVGKLYKILLNKVIIFQPDPRDLTPILGACVIRLLREINSGSAVLFTSLSVGYQLFDTG